MTTDVLSIFNAVCKFSELENIMTNSYKKGVYAENKLEDILVEKLGEDFSIDNVGKRDSHSTDIHVKNEDDEGIVFGERTIIPLSCVKKMKKLH